MLTHASIAEYRTGTELGWHRDVPDFEVVAGVSLAGVAVAARDFGNEGITVLDYVSNFAAPVIVALGARPAKGMVPAEGIEPPTP